MRVSDCDNLFHIIDLSMPYLVIRSLFSQACHVTVGGRTRIRHTHTYCIGWVLKAFHTTI